MRFGCLVNSLSGGRRGQELYSVLNSVSHADFSVTCFEASRDGCQQLLQQSQNFDRILIAGGDGTVSRFVGFAPDLRIPIGIIPLGTGNDLARELNIVAKCKNFSAIEILEFFAHARIRNLQSWTLSCGGVQHMLFLNYVSFGFDGAVVRDFHHLRAGMPWLSSVLGRSGNRLCYILAALRQAFTASCKELQMQCDGEEVALKLPARTVFFSNICSVMGLSYWKPPGDPEDLLLEMRLMPSLFNYLALFCGLQHLNLPPVEGKVWKVEFSEPVVFQLDGEDCSASEYSTFEISSAGKVPFCSA